MTQGTESIHTPFGLVRKKRYNLKQGFFLSLVRTFGFAGAVTLFVILFFVAYNGIHVLSWEFITEPPMDAMTKGGIFPVIVGTVSADRFLHDRRNTDRRYHRDISVGIRKTGVYTEYGYDVDIYPCGSAVGRLRAVRPCGFCRSASTSA